MRHGKLISVPLMRKQCVFALYRQRTASTNGMRVCVLSFVFATSTAAATISQLVSDLVLKKMLRLVFVVVLALFAYAQGESCVSPKLTVSSYSTRDARLTAEPVAQLEFTVKCKSGKQVSSRRSVHRPSTKGFILAKYPLC